MGDTAEYLCKLLGYDKFLPMNSACEGAETAVKLARRWGYNVKGIPDNEAIVIVMKGAFWGRSITASGASDDPIRYERFGPFTPGFELVDYNNIPALRKKFEEKGKNICAVKVEPI